MSRPAARDQRERLAVVVGEHLGVVLGSVAGERREPLGRRAGASPRAPLAGSGRRRRRARVRAGTRTASRRRSTERRSRRTNSFRSSAWRIRSSASASAPGQKTLPITDASWSSDFSSGARPSMRAAIRPCTVSGSGRSPSSCSREHPRVLLGVERVALGTPEHCLLASASMTGASSSRWRSCGRLLVR